VIRLAVTSVRQHPAVTYVWRDPRRLTQARIDALAAHDAYIALLERGTPRTAEQRERDRIRKQLRTHADRIAAYARHRAEGLTVEDAAKAAGVGRSTGMRYERELRARQEPR
jgi:hypothetical protein